MMTLPPNGAASRYGPTPGPDYSWISQRRRAAEAATRQPVIFAAQRFGLASTRTVRLHEQIDELSNRILNLPTNVDVNALHALENRLVTLEAHLHNERLSLLRDLNPLAQQARDASVDAIRSAWLGELLRLTEGDAK